MIGNKIANKITKVSKSSLQNNLETIRNEHGKETWQFNDSQDIDVIVTMFNLIEHNDNYSKRSGILWQYCKH